MKLPYLKQASIFFLSILLFLTSCVENLVEQEIYQRPNWLAGKLFEQITKEDNLNTFIICLKKTGYDSLLNTSGSFTVFAPTDEAFTKFFDNNPDYNTVEDIPMDKLKAIVEYQIIYNAWTRSQFQSLDVSGWIDPENQSYNEPRGFKRQTVYKEENQSYPVTSKTGFFQIVPPEESSNQKIVYNSSSKYVPIFFKEYLNIYNLSNYDYEYYFNRVFNNENLYFAGAAIDKEIPAENGFVYKSDKVVLPLPTAEEVLETGSQDHSYDVFLDLIHEFSELTTNFEATFNQPEAKQGLDVDTLYDCNYPKLLFNINSELTGSPNLTIREHFGLLSPTDEAFEEFNEAYINTGWGKLENVPDVIKAIIVNTHMSKHAIYPQHFTSGFLNEVQDRLYINDEDIVQKTFASNSAFLGLNRVIVPRAFECVARPVYLERGYNIMLYAMERTQVLSAIKDRDGEFAFFVPDDLSIGISGGDSSLYINYLNPEKTKYDFRAQDMSARRTAKFSNSVLRKIILNQIGLSTPRGNANKEFIENMAGNYIIVDNTTGVVSGSAPSTFGYNGIDPVEIKPVLYEEKTDNGKVYKVNGLFSFTNRTFWTLFTTKYLKFQSLLLKAGLYDPVNNSYPFLTKNEYFTVFIPSDSAIEASGLDTLQASDLKKIIKYHFVKGELIFTDGNKPEDHYKTTRIDESSSEIKKEYSTLHINPTPDIIEILDKNGEIFTSISLKENSTNIMTTIDTDESSEGDFENVTTGVIHEIDKVLIKEILQID